MNDLLLHGLLGSGKDRIFKRKIWDARSLDGKKDAIPLRTKGRHFDSFPPVMGSLYNRTSYHTSYPYVGPGVVLANGTTELLVLRQQVMSLTNTNSYYPSSYSVCRTLDTISYSDLTTPASFNASQILKFKNNIYLMGTSGTAIKSSSTTFTKTSISAAAFGHYYFNYPIVTDSSFYGFYFASNATFRFSQDLESFTTLNFSTLTNNVMGTNVLVYSTSKVLNTENVFVIGYDYTSRRADLLRLRHTGSNQVQADLCEFYYDVGSGIKQAFSHSDKQAASFTPFEVIGTDKSVVVLVYNGNYLSNNNTSIVYGFDVYRAEYKGESQLQDLLKYYKVGSFSFENSLFTMPGNKNISTPLTMGFNLYPVQNNAVSGNASYYDTNTGRIYLCLPMVVGETGVNYFHTFGILTSDDHGESWNLRYVFDRPYTANSTISNGYFRPFNLTVYRDKLIFSISSNTLFPASFPSFFQANLDAEEVCYDLSV